MAVAGMAGDLIGASHPSSRGYTSSVTIRPIRGPRTPEVPCGTLDTESIRNLIYGSGLKATPAIDSEGGVRPPLYNNPRPALPRKPRSPTPGTVAPRHL